MKRPEREDWEEQYEYFKGDKAALAEHYVCNLGSIYNWIHYFEDLDIILNSAVKVANSDLIDSDVEEEEEKSYAEYMKLHEDSPNKPDIREVTINIPHSCLVVMIADCHFGSKYTDVYLAEEVKKSCVNNDRVYALYNGDLVDYEGSGPPDIKYDQVFAHPRTTRGMAEAYIREFNGSMLLMLTGCHDNWTYRWTGETFTERLRKYIPTRAVFNDSVMLNLDVGDQRYYGHVAHKAGKGSSRYNPSHGLFQELREDFDGDFVVSAHKHRPGIAVQFIRQGTALAINCGAFKRIDFFSNKNYLQQPLSIPAVYFDAEEHKMIPFFDWRDGIRYINGLK